ncbi:MAG TPA: HEAT repeat domain-containing protein, partial [Vulgatibacter sp.]|nr:HEAT repeat domain-containing protein [Vulgatibacter sp.]
MERRSRERTVALAADLEEGSALLGGAVPRFASLPTQAERILAERLAAELVQGPEGARLRAASRLVDIAGEEAVPLLVDALPGAGPALREALADALGRAGGSEAIRAVEELGDDPDPLVRAAAVDASARLLADEPASLADALRGALADDDPKVRRRAALQAAAARGIDPGELLAPVLGDDDRHARRLAAVALGATRRPEAALALVDALLDEDESVREAAAGSAALLFGADAARIAGMAPLQRGRAVARLKAQVAANPSMFAQPGATSSAPSKEEVACREGTPSHREAAPEPERETARLALLDAEPTARVDHELDEDVQAVMRALTLARSFGGASGDGAGGDAARGVANDVASGVANGAAI